MQTTYYTPPQEIDPYLDSNPIAIRGTGPAMDVTSTYFANGLRIDVDAVAGPSYPVDAYLIAARYYLPNGQLALQTTEINTVVQRIKVEGKTWAEQLAATVYQDGTGPADFVLGSVQDDTFTFDPSTPLSLALTSGGIRRKIAEIDGGNGADTIKINDNFSSGRYSVTKNSLDEIVVTLNGTFSEPVNLKNVEYISFNDLGVLTFDEFFDKKLTSDTVDVIVSLFGHGFMLKGLTEVNDGSSHTLIYDGAVINYTDVDPIIMTVVRNGEFTEEFAQEIADSFPENTGVKYQTVVSLVGAAAIDEILLYVAGVDGNYVG